MSEEDFTTALKTKLEGLNNYNDTDIKNDIASLDTAYKTADTALEEKITANEQAIATKVDKVDGMGLSQESFTTALKTKLEGLNIMMILLLKQVSKKIKLILQVLEVI